MRQITMALVAWLAALWLAWLLLAQTNFLYGIWYELLAIEQTIQQYAPQNRYRQNFELTTKTEQQRLLAAIVDAIHQQGQGLDTLRYHDPKGQVLDNLLTPAEIIHLQDVAALIDKLTILGCICLILWLSNIGLQRQPVKLSQLLLSLLVLHLIAGVLILLIGPVTVFYQLHEWLFPAQHQWFFYYQDSLMTTMLKAPDIFAPITLIWLLLAIVILFLLQSLLNRIAHRFLPNQH